MIGCCRRGVQDAAGSRGAHEVGQRQGGACGRSGCSVQVAAAVQRRRQEAPSRDCFALLLPCFGCVLCVCSQGYCSIAAAAAAPSNLSAFAASWADFSGCSVYCIQSNCDNLVMSVSAAGVRLFSIDGCHSAKATRIDLRLAAASLAGKLLFFHRAVTRGRNMVSFSYTYIHHPDLPRLYQIFSCPAGL